ncbi:hypothetical protein BN946_scf184637.g5 [Trametes cinnabarina]|uniref:Translocon-associated protein subunit alpha n=1 Tax=Pycnoporus cinnabarinus TaxID=5643 RepID=A0A060SPX1_PYCCI|nr:hypothetical protein BN946_scf184637.g5 [Trametes cinnabarina]
MTLAAPVDGEAGEPVVLAVAMFPEDNAFGHVINGERNRMFLAIENKSDRNVTLKNIAGSFHHPETNRLIKNTSALNYGVPLLEGASMQLPYTFYSEATAQTPRSLENTDLTFGSSMMLMYDCLLPSYASLVSDELAQGQTYRVTAYDSIVSVVEPESSWLDLKLWTTYLIVAGLLSGLGYYLYTTFVPQPKKRRVPPVSAPVGTVTATGAGGYQEEWIPEHHLKKTTKKAKGSGAATSGDETSGIESGTEGRRRKGKK